MKDVADEKKNLLETIDVLTQSEINLKEHCRHLRSTLADCELKCSVKEQELRDIENKLKNISEHESFQKELLFTAKQRFESQQVRLTFLLLHLLKESLECLLEKFEQLSSRVIKVSCHC